MKRTRAPARGAALLACLVAGVAWGQGSQTPSTRVTMGGDATGNTLQDEYDAGSMRAPLRTTAEHLRDNVTTPPTDPDMRYIIGNAASEDDAGCTTPWSSGPGPFMLYCSWDGFALAWKALGGAASGGGQLDTLDVFGVGPTNAANVKLTPTNGGIQIDLLAPDEIGLGGFVPHTDPGVNHSEYLQGHFTGSPCPTPGDIPGNVTPGGNFQNCTADQTAAEVCVGTNVFLDGEGNCTSVPPPSGTPELVALYDSLGDLGEDATLRLDPTTKALQATRLEAAAVDGSNLARFTPNSITLAPSPALAAGEVALAECGGDTWRMAGDLCAQDTAGVVKSIGNAGGAIRECNPTALANIANLPDTAHHFGTDKILESFCCSMHQGMLGGGTPADTDGFTARLSAAGRDTGGNFSGDLATLTFDAKHVDARTHGAQCVTPEDPGQPAPWDCASGNCPDSTLSEKLQGLGYILPPGSGIAVTAVIDDLQQDGGQANFQISCTAEFTDAWVCTDPATGPTALCSAELPISSQCGNNNECEAPGHFGQTAQLGVADNIAVTETPPAGAFIQPEGDFTAGAINHKMWKQSQQCDSGSPSPGLACTSDGECTPGTCRFSSELCYVGPDRTDIFQFGMKGAGQRDGAGGSSVGAVAFGAGTTPVEDGDEVVWSVVSWRDGEAAEVGITAQFQPQNGECYAFLVADEAGNDVVFTDGYMSVSQLTDNHPTPNPTHTRTWSMILDKSQLLNPADGEPWASTFPVCMSHMDPRLIR